MVEVLALFKEYGLVGLMVGVLAVLSFIFFWMLERKDKLHHNNIHKLLDDEREQRREDNSRFAQSTDKLSDAIKELSDHLRGH